MQIRFDSLDRYEVPKFTLCNPGSVYKNGFPTKAIGILPDTSDEELVLNFNSASELNLRVPRIRRDDPDDDEYVYGIYKALQNRRLIFIDEIGYFVITNTVNGNDADGIHYKDIQAKSCEVEMQGRSLAYIPNGTYRFSADPQSGKSGLIETVVSALPLWTIGHVDESVAEKHRTFEDLGSDLYVLSFLLENVQEAYECIFIFDIINRIINVYDQNNYVKKTDIHITKQDVITSIDIDESSDDLFTAIRVSGNDNVTIGAVNPLGTNVIYKFDHYLSWMSEGLGSKVSEWQDKIKSEEADYYQLNLKYYVLLEKENNLSLEIERLNTQITMYQRLRNNIVAESITEENSLVDEYNSVIISNGGTAVKVYEEIAKTYEEIGSLIKECENSRSAAEAELGDENLGGIKRELSELRQRIDNICAELSFETYFTSEEHAELANYVYEGSYKDDYVTITDIMSYPERFEQMKTLYDRALITLDKASAPTQEFILDVENFIFQKEFEHWSEQLETGCLINVELDENDVALLFLSNITVNYDDGALSMTFGNRFNKFDPKSLFEDVLGDISKSASTIEYIKDILHPIKGGELDSVKAALQSSRDLTMNSALSSENEEVIIDGSGFSGKKILEDGTYDPQQVKLTSKSLVFTNDAWESCKVALGEFIISRDGESYERAYGINAETLIGDIIMGRTLHIIDENGNELMTIMDNKINTQIKGVTETVEGIKSSMTSLSQDSEKIVARVEKIESNGADRVTTSTGYTFDENGLSISKEGDEIANTLDNTGMHVRRSDEEILSATPDGVDALNLTSRQYLIIGQNSRFEDYSNGQDGEGRKRTACFYIGN